MADKDIGTRLKTARENAKLTQAKACEALKIPKPQTLSAYERGENSPPIEMLKGLSKLYQVSIDWIVYGEDYPHSKPKETIDYIKDLFCSADKLGLQFCQEEDWNCNPNDSYVIRLGSSTLRGFNGLVRDLYKIYGVRDVLDAEDYKMLVQKKISDHAAMSNGFETPLDNLVEVADEELPF